MAAEHREHPTPPSPGHERTLDAAPRRRRPHRDRPAIALNLTAMIDVTFLLLVYFIVATEFKVGEEVYRLDLPERLPAAQQLDPFELDEEPLRIQVLTINAKLDSYRLRLEAAYESPRTFDELYEFLRARRREELYAADHPIIIEPSPYTVWQHALGAFDAAARAKYTNVTLGKPD